VNRSFVSSSCSVATVLAVFVAAPASPAEPATTSQHDMTPYLTPQRVVQVGNGRTINLVCLGQGSPTIILSAGMGGWSFSWRPIQSALAERTRTCGWDRAGHGFSSPSPDPQDTAHTTRDLERALKKAGIAGPYVMVSHSLGAYESLRFTDRNRKSVVGMVLVDPDIPDRAAVNERLAPRFAALSNALEDQDVKRRQDCAEALRAGTAKSGTPRFEQCTAAPVPDTFPRLKAAIAQLNADPARQLTQASLEKEHYNSSRQITDARRRYGDMPLIVLTAGRDEESIQGSLSHLPPGTPGAGTPEERAQLSEQVARFIRDGWNTAHEAYAALSSRGRHELVPDSTHDIASHEPEVVISAIMEVLNASQASAGLVGTPGPRDPPRP
jgi:pimeloyl-ACP methyl ester carboxylesterase